MASGSRRFTRCAAVTGGVALLLGALLAAASGCRPVQRISAQHFPDVTLTPQDRLLVLAPHPDDETLCCGGLIQQAVRTGVPVRVVFFTNGDNNEWSFFVYRKHPVLFPRAVRGMGQVRHEEALAAVKLLGLSPNQVTFLGYPDFGTLYIWKRHWGDRPAYRSMLTRATAVPYASALRPGAPHKGEEVLHDLTTVLREFRPTKVFVSHPADKMPDHAALYLFTRVALWDLERELPSPELYPYLVHFKHWPHPKGLRKEALLEPPQKFQEAIPWRSHPLTPAEVEWKLKALKTHRTQYTVSAKYLLSFIRMNELFGDFLPVRLGGGREAAFSSEDPDHEPEALEELTDVERAAFVGVETRSVQLDGKDVVVSIGFSRPLAQAVEASVYIFGYRADRPFATMPKLHVKTGTLTSVVYDQDRVVAADTVRVGRRFKQLTIRVPLDALGQPQKIFTSARTHLSEVPLDGVSWRIFDVGGGQG